MEHYLIAFISSVLKQQQNRTLNLSRSLKFIKNIGSPWLLKITTNMCSPLHWKAAHILYGAQCDGIADAPLTIYIKSFGISHCDKSTLGREYVALFFFLTTKIYIYECTMAQLVMFLIINMFCWRRSYEIKKTFFLVLFFVHVFTLTIANISLPIDSYWSQPCMILVDCVHASARIVHANFRLNVYWHCTTAVGDRVIQSFSGSKSRRWRYNDTFLQANFNRPDDTLGERIDKRRIMLSHYLVDVNVKWM